MIIACPVCKARYRLKNPPDYKRVLRFKCAKCGEDFQLTIQDVRQNKNINILIAHDDFRVVNIIKKLLSKLQFSIDVAYDGIDAFNFIKNNKPAAAIVDVALPGMFGFELCEKVKNNPAIKDVRIILVASIYDRTRYKRKPQNLYGADDYIEKHHIPDELLSKLLRLLSHHGAHEEPADSRQPEKVQREHLKDNRDVLLEDRKIEAKIDRDRQQIKQHENDYLDAIPHSEQRAKKLARLIVSDIALYNPEIIAEITLDNYSQKLRLDVEDGIKHLSKKVPEISAQAQQLIHEAIKEMLENSARVIS